MFGFFFFSNQSDRAAIDSSRSRHIKVGNRSRLRVPRLKEQRRPYHWTFEHLVLQVDTETVFGGVFGTIGYDTKVRWGWQWWERFRGEAYHFICIYARKDLQFLWINCQNLSICRRVCMESLQDKRWLGCHLKYLFLLFDVQLTPHTQDLNIAIIVSLQTTSQIVWMSMIQ